MVLVPKRNCAAAERPRSWLKDLTDVSIDIFFLQVAVRCSFDLQLVVTRCLQSLTTKVRPTVAMVAIETTH